MTPMTDETTLAPAAASLFRSTIRSRASCRTSTSRAARLRSARRDCCSSTRRWPTELAPRPRVARRLPSKAAIFAGNAVPAGAEPLAQAYAGHQFGGFVPQLGDGRALLLGEVIDRHGHRRDIAFKGSGRTRVRARRRRQGRRRADAARGAGQRVDARARHSDHARACGRGDRRGSLSRARAARRRADARRGEPPSRRHVPVLRGARRRRQRCASSRSTRSRATTPTVATTASRSSALLRNVVARQASLIAQWMNVGFIHGVMNTDNMTISGETIDYGPCAFMEAYDPAAVFSSIDDARPLRVRQPARHRGVEPRALRRDAAAADRRRRRTKRSRMATEVARRLSAPHIEAHLRRASGPSSDCATEAPTTTMPRSPTTGSRCCMRSASTSRSRGAGSPMRPTATRRRCARCSPTRMRSMPGSRAGARGAERRAPTARCAVRCAASIPSSSPATIASRKRSPRRRRDDLAPFERLLAASAALRRGRRAGAVRRARPAPK